MRGLAARMKLHSGYKYEPDGTRVEPESPNLQALSGRNARISAYGHAGAGFRLTPRQKELIQLLADGKVRPDAALVMGISENAVRNLLVRVARKNNTETTLHAVAIALRIGLIT